MKEENNEFKKIERWKIVAGDNLLEIEIPEVKFLVEKLIPLGITILAGRPSSFKSWLLLKIAEVVARGQPLFDKFKTKQNKVLFIDEETHLPEIKRRWLKIKGTEPTSVDFVSMIGFKIDNKEDREFLLSITKKEKYNLIIFDSLRDIHSKNENDSREAQELMDCFKEFTRKGISILISHHNRKESYLNTKEAGQVLRGSTAILASIDSLLAVQNPKTTKEYAELVITQAKLRQNKKNPPFRVNVIEEEEKMRFDYAGELEDAVSKTERTKEAICELVKEQEMYVAQINEALVPQGFTITTIQTAIKELKTEGKFEMRAGEKRRIYLKLKQ